MVKINLTERTWFYAFDTNLFTIVIIFILLSNGKDKPPRRDMVLCLSSKSFHDSNFFTV